MKVVRFQILTRAREKVARFKTGPVQKRKLLWLKSYPGHERMFLPIVPPRTRLAGRKGYDLDPGE